VGRRDFPACTIYGTRREVDSSHASPGSESGKRVSVIFYKTEAGNEPVRAWLKDELAREDRLLIGLDIKTAEYAWPLGLPTCRPMKDGSYEVRTHLPSNRVARVFFYVDKFQRMVLLHGIIKKSQKTPVDDLELAQHRMAQHEKGVTQ